MNQLQALLSAYSPSLEEITVLQKCKELANEGPISLSRERTAGHFTASAWVVNQHTDSALLLFHRKLEKWLQPGGHADDNADLYEVAKKELAEETGLHTFHSPTSQIFDIDIHQIPAHKTVPEHLHYDIRFIFVADDRSPITFNHESIDLKWIPFHKIIAFTNNPSILRMIEKTNTLK